MTNKLNKDPYPQAEYERLYEMYDQDTQCAVYDVMDLMSEIKEHKQNIKALCDRLDELENVQG